MMLFRKLFFAFVLLFSLCRTAQPHTIIHAGRLIDGRSDAVREAMSIVIDQGRIAAVQEGYAEPQSADTVIDLRECTVMPGWMDMHTHLMSEHHAKVYSDKFFMNEADYALRSTAYAKRTLMAGFTSVRDLGDNGVNSVSLRKAIDEGWVVGPRIFTSGKSLATTGGHADPTNGLKGDFRRDAGPVEGVVNGVDDARKAVRQRYKDGADLIKLTATGGILSLAASGQNPQFSDDELRAIVATAKDYGMTVAVHAHGTEGMKRSVLAGVDSIEHGTFMTDEVMELMKERGTYLVPTISAGVWVAEKAEEEGYFPEIVRPKAAEIGPVARRTFARAYASGVKIAFGTDSGVSKHGENAREFELMVAGGMPPMKAIQAATLEAARLLRVEDRLGTLEVKKIADVVAVKGDPLEDIKLTRDVAFVMKEGVVYKNELSEP
ncbi:MAG: amidohydrolase family protein [Planctomycetales bacterium]|nr:amidohydrolase family protein [Planctomycetales bacterium]